MNPFQIRVEKFDFSLPLGGVIPAAQLQEMEQCRDRVSDAHTQAADIVQSAQAESARLLAQAQQQVDKLLEHTRSQLEIDVLAQHVSWLVAAEQLESVLITQGRELILAAIASVVTAWAGEQEASQILIHRLGAQVEKMALDDAQVLHGLMLRVHPQHFSAVASALGARVRCIADEKMASDQAQLSSPMLQITLSLQHHLSQLLQWLQESPKQEFISSGAEHDKCP
ncbi:type III secretion system stator protein SctL [Yersinia rochesterensis]|uniref:type III secretion system stator protein SctL n=1 Tax=Yersinia TaxID=629 RepID=UPI0022406256|nr:MULTISPECIES: type III secretion system stator protein SctL [Yersinia]MDA5545750.1 type III secretion system stator protein SctL [Yersinia rochesterensis]UZM75419.1 type III secretion system stator protein SctL [Yersinia sp. SCPM-O-B-9106 (C-191)]